MNASTAAWCTFVSAWRLSALALVVPFTGTRKDLNGFTWGPFISWHRTQPKNLLSPRWPVASHVALAKRAALMPQRFPTVAPAATVGNSSRCLDKNLKAMHHVHPRLQQFALCRLSSVSLLNTRWPPAVGCAGCVHWPPSPSPSWSSSSPDRQKENTPPMRNGNIHKAAANLP